MIAKHITLQSVGSRILVISNAANISRQLHQIEAMHTLGQVPNFNNQEEINDTPHAHEIEALSGGVDPHDNPAIFQDIDASRSDYLPSVSYGSDQ